MNDDKLFEAMKGAVRSVAQGQDESSFKVSRAEVVLAEYPVTSTELHKIANGDCCTINDPSCPFSLRFMLKKSFKSSCSDFVINNYVIQIVASETKKFLRKEEIATKTKVVKGRQKRSNAVPIETGTEVKDTNRSLF